MLHIFLVILKIMGMILAVLAGILLFFILAALFVPVRYRFEGCYYTMDENRNNYLRGMISFLGPILRLKISYKEEFEWDLRFLFFSLKPFFSKSLDEPEGDREANVWEKEDCQDEEEELELINLNDHTRRTKKIAKEALHQQHAKNNAGKRGRFRLGRGMSWLQKITKLKQKIIEGFHKMRRLFSDFGLLFDKLQELKKDGRFKEAFVYIKERIMAVLKRSWPSIEYLNLYFGTDNPALTGKIVGAASILYACFGTSAICVEPDFGTEEFVFKGQGKVKGKIWLLDFIKLIYDYLFHKEVQYFKQKLSNLRRNF